ncbi:peptidoglycan DD-metalloendopeptidase family protein [Oscillatoria sp. CS-180]|uniref:peptidoglycan DD-metalloendopeptidase family protein n=1 Tax=Oscillatoria sp. CS-180 TaxID=3021720 RepID=UPI00232C13AC|nr:peptidoglycan DD-metalloendopeptidase family protein [Oscillatoria sp. CS-180]MDB9524910.1 peptidoglycan DD-metalloendopeptidase family protein [Oscillatoria sp. CS-180]
MSPVFTQEFIPDTQSQLSPLVPFQSTQGSIETGRKVRTSFTVLSLALSIGAAGSFISSAEAVDSTHLAALPSVTNAPSPLPSFGSARPEGASATYHTVSVGETIWDIAKHHGVTVSDIKSANGIGEDQVIQAGQVLKVPAIARSTPATTQLSPVADSSPTVEVEEDVAQSEETIVALANPQESVVDVPQLSESVEEAKASPSTLSEFLEAQQPELEANRSVETAASSAEGIQLSEVSVPVPDSPTTDFEPEAKAEAVPSLEMPTASTSTESTFSLEARLSNESDGKAAEVPSLAIVPAATEERELVHHVSSGETLWSIARSYGVEPDNLQQVNQLSNPNFIVSGDELVIPADVAFEAIRESEQESATTAIVPTTESETVDDFPVDELVAFEKSTGLNEASFSEPAETTEAVVTDPFVEGLLSDVAEATRSQLDVTSDTAERYSSQLVEVFEPEELAAVENAQLEADGSAFPEEDIINPQFSDAADLDSSVELDVDPLLAEELLAAAPLGSEVYAPIIETPEGRVVSPDMPVLPPQDEYLPEAPDRFDGYIWPAHGVLTSGYGYRWGRMHRGVDIAGPVGTPIYAAGPGVVERSGWNSGGYGKLIDVRHPDGSMTRYAHNSQLLVSAGQQVRQGQQIAEMGSTGYSTGPHLHFEIHLPDQGTVNPMAYLPNR